MFDRLKRPSEVFTAEELALLQKTYQRIIQYSGPAGCEAREEVACRILCKFREGARTHAALLRAVQRDYASRSSMRLVYDRLAEKAAFPEREAHSQ